MQSLQKDHITDLYVLIDDMLPKKLKNGSQTGRPTLLENSELLTILAWNSLTVKQRNLKDLYNYTRMHFSSEFPKLPKYTGFVCHCHRITPVLLFVLRNLLLDKAAIKFMDSTMLEVCKLQRADDHKVCKGLAKFGKNWQGWHFGFKPHTGVDAKGRICSFALTPADVYDAQMIPALTNKHTKIIVGDSHYGAKAMREHIFEKYGTIIVSPPHFKQRKKVATIWQNILLSMRSKIESTFDYLKNHLNIVTSFPRSINGYLFHYLRILLGYQLLALSF